MLWHMGLVGCWGFTPVGPGFLRSDRFACARYSKHSSKAMVNILGSVLYIFYSCRFWCHTKVELGSHRVDEALVTCPTFAPSTVFISPPIIDGGLGLRECMSFRQTVFRFTRCYRGS